MGFLSCAGAKFKYKNKKNWCFEMSFSTKYINKGCQLSILKFIVFPFLTNELYP